MYLCPKCLSFWLHSVGNLEVFWYSMCLSVAECEVCVWAHIHGHALMWICVRVQIRGQGLLSGLDFQLLWHRISLFLLWWPGSWASKESPGALFLPLRIAQGLQKLTLFVQLLPSQVFKLRQTLLFTAIFEACILIFKLGWCLGLFQQSFINIIFTFKIASHICKESGFVPQNSYNEILLLAPRMQLNFQRKSLKR